MAKISTVNPATNNEALAHLKDQFQNRERETEARFKDDVRELRESHRSELSRVREDAEKRIQELREENSAKLTQKDLQYQKEIEAIKAMYAKRPPVKG